MPYADHINAECLSEVLQHMKGFVRPYVTQICTTKDGQIGEAHGSATFVSLKGRPYVLTNEHVPRLAIGSYPAHFVGNGKNVSAITYPFLAAPFPLDVAIARIEPDAIIGGDRSILPTEFLGKKFEPVVGEVMFFLGHPIDASEFVEEDGTLKSKAIPVATNLVDLPTSLDLDPAKHIAIHYSLYAQTPEGAHVGANDPVGISGTALWDTKYVASGADGWVIEDARIAALIFGHRAQDNMLLALKIEYVREFLIDALRHEAAYYRSLQLRTPPSDALGDWLWAEMLITGLE